MKRKQEQGFRILEFKENKFDIIGDVHGCYDELLALIEKLGYRKEENCYVHPEGRRLISVGDVADKGEKNLESLDFWLNQVEFGGGFWIHGNHCSKLYRYLLGNRVVLAHGLENTVEELNRLTKEEKAEFRHRYMRCYESQCDYLLLDQKRLAVVHGGLKEADIGQFSGQIRAVCLYGEVEENFSEEGKPKRLDWAADYKGEVFVVYGHTVVDEARIVNNTIDVDQGCVYGGMLTALRYPEKAVVQIKSKKIYAKN